jgi:peptidoglycan/LPS O-acetylase OafA/YrhL
MSPPGPYPALELSFPSVGKKRIESVDELKGLAMILVILYHAGGVLVWQNFLHGDIGVDLFVILSGVGLAMSTRMESAGEFLKRRLLRIYPAYWVVLTLFLILGYTFLELRHSAFDIAVHFLGIHAWFGDYFGFGIDDSFWFVTLIVNVYLIYAFVLRPIMERADLVVLWGALICTPVAYAYFLTGQGGCFGHIAMRLPGFFFGVLLGRLLRDGRLSLPLSPAMAIGLPVLIYIPYTRGVTFYTELVALSLIVAYVYFWRATAPRAAARSTGRVLRFFGTYSLEIFLLHQPLMRDYNVYVLGRFFHEPNPTPASLVTGMVVGLALTLILSVELHRALNRILGTRETPPPSAVAAA